MTPPPRRRATLLRLPGSLPERTAVAVSWYADGIALHDIVEVCQMSVSSVQRAVIRAGVPLRDKAKRGKPARSLALLVSYARGTPLEPQAWRAEHALSERSAAAIWYLAAKSEKVVMGDSIAPIPMLSRRCHVCGAVSTNPERCNACHVVR